MSIHEEKNMLFRTLSMLLLALAVTGCASVQKQAFNREAAAGLKSVAIAEHTNKEEYFINIVAHPGMSFGLIGGLVAAAELSSKASRLTAAVKPEQTELQKRLARQLNSGLGAAGFETHVVPLQPDTENKLVATTLGKSANSDAVLAASVSAGYIAASPTTPYFPYVQVNVMLSEGSTNKVLYQDSISYGYSYPHTKTVHLAGGEDYHFSNMNDLEEHADRARDGLTHGLDLVVAQIVADLKKN